MDERLARQLVRNQFRLMDLSKVIMQRSADALDQAIINAARLISTLPSAGDLMREQAWKAMQPRIAALFDQAAQGMGKETIAVLTDEISRQVEFAAGYITPIGKTPAIEWTTGKSTLNGKPLTGTAIVPQTGPGFALGASGGTPAYAQEMTTRSIGAVANVVEQFTVTVPPKIANVVKDIRIAGQTLERTFGAAVIDGGAAVTVGNSKTGLGKFLMTSVDRRVRQGFLMGQTTEELAQELFIDALRQGGQLGPTAMQLKRGATAVARTAVQDLASRVHEQVWDANSDRIKAYQFDASSDSRACPTCSALDGKTGTKEQIPRPPIHPQCRCQKLPLTATALELRKQGDIPNGTGVELVAVDEMPIKQRKGESQRDYIRRVKAQSPKGERWYSTPVNQNGKRFWRRSRDLDKPGGVLGWLADPKTTDSSLDQAFGGGDAGIIRRKWFRSQLAKGSSPQEVYKAMLDFNGMTNRSVKPERLARFKPVKELPGASKIQVGKADRHRPISR